MQYASLWAIPSFLLYGICSGRHLSIYLSAFQTVTYKNGCEYISYDTELDTVFPPLFILSPINCSACCQKGISRVRSSECCSIPGPNETRCRAVHPSSLVCWGNMDQLCWLFVTTGMIEVASAAAAEQFLAHDSQCGKAGSPAIVIATSFSTYFSTCNFLSYSLKPVMEWGWNPLLRQFTDHTRVKWPLWGDLLHHDGVCSRQPP